MTNFRASGLLRYFLEFGFLPRRAAPVIATLLTYLNREPDNLLS